VLQFDFDTPEADGVRLKTKWLMALSKSLDYALLETVSPADWTVPHIAPSMVELDRTSDGGQHFPTSAGHAQAGRIPEQPDQRSRRDHRRAARLTRGTF
jgi:hypothetical protein